MKKQNIVKDARKQLGLTQVALAQELGVISTTVSRWETGAAKPPTPTLRLLEMLVAAKGGKR